jgi:hypothetical protein
LEGIKSKTHNVNSGENAIEELIEKEVEDSLFHLGQWGKLTSTIEKKYPPIGMISFIIYS